MQLALLFLFLPIVFVRSRLPLSATYQWPCSQGDSPRPLCLPALLPTPPPKPLSLRTLLEKEFDKPSDCRWACKQPSCGTKLAASSDYAAWRNHLDAKHMCRPCYVGLPSCHCLQLVQTHTARTANEAQSWT
jgi:hypothetical protein